MSGNSPRSAPPAAVTTRPVTSAQRTPSRATISEPGTAAAANSIDGRPVRMPICVADIRNWSWISGITGGTARIVSRRALPASQSSSSAISARLREAS
jgi:hypothetical protein